jgi:hypothetical protein
VYAIWFSMFGTEQRDDWPADILTDRRVTHWWDEGKAVGRWYMPRIGQMRDTLAAGSGGFAGNVLWDSYLVYGPEAQWDESPTGLRRWGRTILRTQEGLREAFAALLQNDTRSR